MESILEENKTYLSQESKELLEEVRGFMQGKLKMVGVEWTFSKRSWNQDETLNKGIELFFIKKGVAPIDSFCNSLEDMEKQLDQLESRLICLADSFYALVDNNPDLEKESKNSLESYAKTVDKSVTILENQRKKRRIKWKELSGINEFTEEIKSLIRKIIGDYVISVLADALYERIKNNAGEVYTLVIKEMNQFLIDNGVYTKEIKVGEQMDPEYVEPTKDSIENITEDFHKFDTIEEIRRYPYLFLDDTKILDGSAKIWRRNDEWEST